jgi:hypothetical protein
VADHLPISGSLLSPFGSMVSGAAAPMQRALPRFVFVLSALHSSAVRVRLRPDGWCNLLRRIGVVHVTLRSELGPMRVLFDKGVHRGCPLSSQLHRLRPEGQVVGLFVGPATQRGGRRASRQTLRSKTLRDSGFRSRIDIG